MNKKKYFKIQFRFIIFILITTISSNFLMAINKAITNFNVQDYTGMWYEVARLENSFQDGCEFVKAYYAVNEQGNMDVTNYCLKNNQPKIFKNSLVFKENNTVADFSVKAFLFFTVTYRIIYLDNINGYALVDSGDLSHLWILSREQKLGASQVNYLLDIAKAKGFNLSKLHYTKQ